jgi:hypothetical protein
MTYNNSIEFFTQELECTTGEPIGYLDNHPVIKVRVVPYDMSEIHNQINIDDFIADRGEEAILKRLDIESIKHFLGIENDT